MSFRKLSRLLLISTLSFWSCSDDPVIFDEPTINLSQLPYEKLSDYHFFEEEMRDFIPTKRVLPYDLNTPLFTDYAAKSRFIYIPEGQSAAFTEEGILDFPDGSILIKNFYYLADIRDENSTRDIIETRLLFKRSGKWHSAEYIWNDAENEAFFSILGEQRTVSWTHYDGNTLTANYLIPNKNECKSCHSVNEKLMPIGPKSLHLNGLYDYEEGSMNQLDKWSINGFLDGYPGSSNAPSTPVWDDPSSGTLSERARAYLETNCAHCHSAQGPANNSGLFLDYAQTDTFALGFCKPPVATGSGSGGFEYAIVAGNADSSIMVYRMVSLEIDVAMPEIGRSVVHEEAVALIREWIDSLEGGCD